MQKHGSQKRASGDPYFSHPIEVAGLMTDLQLDQETIMTALLHDTVEDTLATIDDIEANFGPEVARLLFVVDSITCAHPTKELPNYSYKGRSPATDFEDEPLEFSTLTIA